MLNKTLLVNTTEYITCDENDAIKFDHTTVIDLQDFIPYHDDVDLDSKLCVPESLDPTTVIHEEICSDPFIVDKVVDKFFHTHCNQYEYMGRLYRPDIGAGRQYSRSKNSGI